MFYFVTDRNVNTNKFLCTFVSNWISICCITLYLFYWIRISTQNICVILFQFFLIFYVLNARVSYGEVLYNSFIIKPFGVVCYLQFIDFKSHWFSFSTCMPLYRKKKTLRALYMSSKKIILTIEKCSSTLYDVIDITVCNYL